jgi:hypothetical protein
VAQHLQAFCKLLTAHCHHIVVIPLLSSNHRCPIVIFESPLLSSLTLGSGSTIIDAVAIAIAIAVAISAITVIAIIIDVALLTLLHHRCC